MPSRPSLYDAACQLHKLFRLVQRQNRVILTDPDIDLSSTQIMVMLEFDGNISRGVSEISDRLRITQSTASRTISSLKELRLLQNISTSDRRCSPVRLTPRVRKRMAKSDAITNKAAKLRLSKLSRAMRNDLINGLRIVADALRSPETLQRKIDHPLRLQIRRLTKTLGFTSRTLMSSGVTTTEWQVLSEIHESSGISPTEISKRLVTHHRVVANVVKGLEKKGYVSRTSKSPDKRVHNIYLTESGRRILDKIDSGSAKSIAKALRKEQLSDLLKLCSALKKYLSA